MAGLGPRPFGLLGAALLTIAVFVPQSAVAEEVLSEDDLALIRALTSTASPPLAEDEPLDADTLALVDALTSSTAEPPPPVVPAPPVWPSAGPLTRRISSARLRETLARDLDGARELMPTLDGGLRSYFGSWTELDGLRLERRLGTAGRLAPTLYDAIEIARGPDASGGPRLWVSQSRLRGFQAGNGVHAWARLEARSADRSLGVSGRVSVGDADAGLSVAFRVEGAEDLRVRSSTRAYDLDRAGMRYGLSARGRLGDEGLRLDVGYDLDLEAPSGSRTALPDLHLARAGVSANLDGTRVRLLGGWMSAGEEQLLTARIDASWGVERLQALPDATRSRQGGLELQLGRTQLVEGEVRVGGLYTRSVTDLPLERTELWGATLQRIEAFELAVSARVSKQKDDTVDAPIDLALDARGAVDLGANLSWWVRFARTFSLLDAGAGQAERGHLVESGPYLSGSAGWLSASLWWVSMEDLALQDGAFSDADLWGLAAEGALELERFALAGALSRGEALDLGPEPILRARLAARMHLPEIGGFVELGLRSWLESTSDTTPLLRARPTEEGPLVVLDLRGAAELGAGFRLNASVANLIDDAWPATFSSNPTHGIDVRLALGWRPIP